MNSSSENNNSSLTRTNTIKCDSISTNVKTEPHNPSEWADTIDEWNTPTTPTSSPPMCDNHDTTSVPPPLFPVTPSTSLALVIKNQQHEQQHLEHQPPTTPTTPPPQTCYSSLQFSSERWTLAKIITIHSHSVTLVEHDSGNLLKARPQSFSQKLQNGKRQFIKIQELPLHKGDILECFISDIPWKHWDSRKGGKDIKGWVQECIPHHDSILSNGTLADTSTAKRISFQFSAQIKSSGHKFSILHNIRDVVGKSLHGNAFCHFSNIPPSPIGTTVHGTAIPFIHTNKHAKNTHFIVVSVSKVTPH